MPSLKVTLQGMGKLQRALKEKPDQLKPILQRVVKHHGAQLQQKEMRAVPVDTGTLKRSIMLDISYSGLTATVEPTAHYAPYVEYGTRFMNAQPYVRPSFNAQAALFKADLNKLVK